MADHAFFIVTRARMAEEAGIRLPPPKPYDPEAPVGSHPWDTKKFKWNGNL
jgi:hypothetical protein